MNHSAPLSVCLMFAVLGALLCSVTRATPLTASHHSWLVRSVLIAQVLEVDAFASVHEMLHAAILSYGSQATLREVCGDSLMDLWP